MANDYKANKKLLGKARPTTVQQALISTALKKKYPQMYGGALPAQRTQQISDQLRKAGIDEATINRMRGKK